MWVQDFVRLLLAIKPNDSLIPNLQDSWTILACFYSLAHPWAAHRNVYMTTNPSQGTFHRDPGLLKMYTLVYQLYFNLKKKCGFNGMKIQDGNKYTLRSHIHP